MRYNILWNDKNRTLTIVDGDENGTKTNTLISHLVAFEEGEVPDSASHPEPRQHLKNLASQQGYEDFRLITVKNSTDNERLDKLEQEADEKATEAYETREEGKILDNPKMKHEVDEPAEDEKTEA